MVHQLRPFNYDPERTRPVDIARQTAQEFLIGDILAHRGDQIADPRWNSWWDGKILRVQTRGSHMQDSDMQKNCMSTCEYIRCDRWYLLNISNRVSNAGFFYNFFILLEVLVSKSLTSLCLLTTVYNWHHISTSINVSLRYVHNAFMKLLHCILHRRCFYEFRKHLQYAFWCAYNFYVQPSVSHQLSFHTNTYNFIYAYIFDIWPSVSH